MKLIDLHIHSNLSDGSDDWKTILKRAESLNLSCISITDHDNCDVYAQIETPGKYFSGKILNGIEMQAYIKGLSIELLGYDFDIPKMQALLKGLYLPFATVNLEELQRLHKKCVENGINFPPNVIENYDSNKYFYATEYLHTEMHKLPENKALIPDPESWERESVFFKRHTSNPNSPYYIDESDIVPSAQQVIDIIHKSGGKVFIPHVYQYEENAEMVLHELIDHYEIDGIECYYPSFTEQQTNHLLNFCQKHNLLISGGTDCHGENRTSTNKMGMLKIDASEMEWINSP